MVRCFCCTPLLKGCKAHPLRDVGHRGSAKLPSWVRALVEGALAVTSAQLSFPTPQPDSGLPCSKPWSRSLAQSETGSVCVRAFVRLSSLVPQQPIPGHCPNIWSHPSRFSLPASLSPSCSYNLIDSPCVLLQGSAP